MDIQITRSPQISIILFLCQLSYVSLKTGHQLRVWNKLKWLFLLLWKCREAGNGNYIKMVLHRFPEFLGFMPSLEVEGYNFFKAISVISLSFLTVNLPSVVCLQKPLSHARAASKIEGSPKYDLHVFIAKAMERCVLRHYKDFIVKLNMVHFYKWAAFI